MRLQLSVDDGSSPCMYANVVLRGCCCCSPPMLLRLLRCVSRLLRGCPPGCCRCCCVFLSREPRAQKPWTSETNATQAELCPATVCVTSELGRAVERENERMKGSGRAAPNGRDKGRYGANRQVRASANARKWKGMIEYVTFSLLVLEALMVGWCLPSFSGPNRAFWLFATKPARVPKLDRAPSAMHPPCMLDHV